MKIVLHEYIENILSNAGSEFQEIIIRHHFMTRNLIRVKNGELEETGSENLAGVGIRVLIDGCWGFSSLSGSEDTIRNFEQDLKQSLVDSSTIAKTLSKKRNYKIELADPKTVTEDYRVISTESSNYSLEEMMKLSLEIDSTIKDGGTQIKSSGVLLGEIKEQKAIYTLSGTRVKIFSVKSDMYISAIANENSKIEYFTEARGNSGTIKELMTKYDPFALAKNAARISIKKLDAKIPKAGEQLVILDPEIVGLLCHEAIGHTVEADFVLSGSITKDKLAKNVASPEITMVDSGLSNDGAGWCPVDDEGTQVEETILIEAGILKSYLHNRETAARMKVDPTGNARAGGYSQEPLIRMTNTYITSGDWSREEIISDTKAGILLAGAGSGEADANAEFVFDVAEAYPIKNGEICEEELLRGVAISGSAFRTLKSVDAVADNFKMKMGAGACIKGGQPIKVDGGGPSIRCKVRIAGKDRN